MKTEQVSGRRAQGSEKERGFLAGGAQDEVGYSVSCSSTSTEVVGQTSESVPFDEGPSTELEVWISCAGGKRIGEKVEL